MGTSSDDTGSEPPFSGSSTRLREAVDTATFDDIVAHLLRCDAGFQPRLSERVRIQDYAAQIRARAVTFEAWSGATLVGLVAAYLNDPNGKEGFVTNVSVDPENRGLGIGDALMRRFIQQARRLGFKRLRLEVGIDNGKAIALYRRHGFGDETANGGVLAMARELKGEAEREQ